MIFFVILKGHVTQSQLPRFHSLSWTIPGNQNSGEGGSSSAWCTLSFGVGLEGVRGAVARPRCASEIPVLFADWVTLSVISYLFKYAFVCICMYLWKEGT